MKYTTIRLLKLQAFRRKTRSDCGGLFEEYNLRFLKLKNKRERERERERET